MSASERLAALEAAIPRLEHGYFLPERTASVIDALPEIVAVVRAAEAEVADCVIITINGEQQHPAMTVTRLLDALAALDAKLASDG